MLTLRKLLEKINSVVPFEGDLAFDEPMRRHTTFQVGGPADLWIRPRGARWLPFVQMLLQEARAAEIPVFFLGSGANLVVADRGIRGIVLDCTGYTGLSFGPDDVFIRAGTEVNEAIRLCVNEERSSLEFLAGMPGSIGGAVWMNARCYGSSVSDRLREVQILNEALMEEWVPYREGDYDYKKSPFQGRPVLILGARFVTQRANKWELEQCIYQYRKDREEKGHYRLPSAGSAFKNNYAYGKPTGKIIDELGLKGLQIGGARVADWHGNIIVNTGNASAADIRNLTEEIKSRVFAATGLLLECEILFVGDW